MPLYLAVLAPNRAAAVIEAYPEIRTWAIAGHSPGGAMASRYVYRHPDAMDGLLLWDAYPPDADDLSDRSLSVTVIQRSDESGEPPEHYAEYLRMLPAHTEYFPIIGASHVNFGLFQPALRFRQAPPATIPIDEPHRLIADASIAFLESL